MLNMHNSMRDFRKSACRVAILPVGALEQHGSHLPVGTDNIIAEAMARSIAEKLDAYLLPVIGITSSIEHRRGEGTVFLKADTLAAVIRDVAESLKYAGYDRLIIINGHGGNWIIKPTVRQLNRDFEDRNEDMEVLLIHTSIVLSRQHEVMEHVQNDLHAGEKETSLMLHLCEEHVQKVVPQSKPTSVPQDFMDYFDVMDITEDGYWGYPETASKSKGERLLELMVECAMDYIHKVDTVKLRVNHYHKE